MRIPARVRRSYEKRRDDERGATLIIVGICATLFLWAGAFSVDLGLQTVGNRQLQTVADAGALDAAHYIDVSGASLLTEAQRGATDNGSNATVTAALGYWTGTQYEGGTTHCSPAIPPPNGIPPCNAVMVTASESVPELFHGGNAPLSRSAIAAINAPPGSTCCGPGADGEAYFSIGTYLASYSSQQTAVLNVLLGGLGGTVDLTAVGYEGLADTNVTLLQLINASAGALTPANVMSASLTSQQWLTILESATGSAYLSTAMGNSNASTQVSLCHLVSINGSTCSSGDLTPSALSATINVLQTLTTQAELANGTNAVNVTPALSLPNVTSATLTTTLIQLPQVAYGPVGTQATTGQVSADLQLTLGQGLGVLNIPVSAADGTATLNTVTCVNNAMTSTKINASTTAASGAVTVLGQNLATLAISGVSTAGLGYSASVVPPTAATASADTNPITIGTTSPVVTFGSQNLGILNALQLALVTPLLSTLADSLGPVLQSIGVSAAGAEVADLNAFCDPVTLEQ
jgi:uncharacterized membrane protein